MQTPKLGDVLLVQSSFRIPNSALAWVRCRFCRRRAVERGGVAETSRSDCACVRAPRNSHAKSRPTCCGWSRAERDTTALLEQGPNASYRQSSALAFPGACPRGSVRRMTGTLINTAAILVGGGLGLKAARQFSVTTQTRIKLGLAAFTLWAGLGMIWNGIGGSFGGVAKQLGIGMLALVLGNVLGTLLHLQDGLNRLGQYAKERIAGASATDGNRFSEGFVTCTLLFCVGPMAILGAIEDGTNGNYKLLMIKAALDGLAAMGFAATFGPGVLLAAVPVLAYQGTITLAANALATHLHDVALINSIRVAGGLVVLCIGVVILELRKVPLANYLPSLVLAPVFTHWWK
ncbi:MAG: DUF554 domain-containing protein [Proteobacteria bacterium]|nr:DUF554 domain-containing protein [Pseudomonadota bacterium]